MLPDEQLIEQAKEASQNAYAPYSGFKIGAALLSKNGNVYIGCNVENASYSLTICAERNAVFKAVAWGEREFTAIAIYADSDEFFPPCGACRQVLSEFSTDMRIIMANHARVEVSTLDQLLPMRFSLDDESETS